MRTGCQLWGQSHAFAGASQHLAARHHGRRPVVCRRKPDGVLEQVPWRGPPAKLRRHPLPLLQCYLRAAVPFATAGWAPGLG